MIHRFLDATLKHPRLTRDYLWGYLWGFLFSRLLFRDAPLTHLTHIEIFTICAFLLQILTMLHMWWIERQEADDAAYLKAIAKFINGPEEKA